MTPERWEAVSAVLQAALARPAAERAAYLDAACAGDPALREEVASLLAAPDTAAGDDSFLGAPPDALAAAEDALAAGLEARLATALAGRYAIERELGRGGMATVYLARDLRHRRHVALKVLAPWPGAHVGPERFRREIETAAGLSHPHVLAVHDSGQADGLLYYVMPYVTGGSLRGLLARGAPAPADAVRLVREVASALDHAHRHGVAHRDVKPENVLLDEEGRALVADFGIARALRAPGPAPADRASLTGTGVVIGTPAYMSPEQALGEADLDGASDQYALACVAFELLAGAPPFTGGSAEQLAQRLTRPPPPLSAARSDLPRAADAVLARALARDPSERFPSAGAFAQALEDAVLRGVGGARRAVGRRRTTIAVLALSLLGVGWWAVATRDGDGVGAVDARPAAPRVRSLAVLPLRNLSGDSTQEYFADGMTEELTTTLAKIEGLRVVSHQSVRQFRRSDRPVPEIARRLGVGHVVSGSVMREGDRLRITATLIDAATDSPVWTERFERERGGVLALQREVAMAVAGAVAVALTPRDRARLAPDRAVDPEVFDLYVRGTQARYLSLGSDAAYRRAMTFFARAVARDSTYAPAHAGLALAASFVGDDAAARRALARALALDPSLAEAHMALGLARQAFDRDWTGAEAALREAIHLNPGYAEAHHELSMVLLRGRRFDEALREARETVYLAPMSARFENGLGEVLHYAGRHAEALAAADKSLALDPASAGAQLLKASAHLGLGQYTEAASTLLACTAEGCGGFGRGLLAYAYARAGRPDAARLLVDSLRGRWADPAARSYVAYDLAVASMGLGEPDQALVWLERGARTATGQSGFMAYVGVEPAFLPLHGLTRFQAVLRALGLPDR